MAGRAAWEYGEAILREAPPRTPTAPWSPEPPEWMRKPTRVHGGGMSGIPDHWADEAPYREWADRVGRAKYQLMRLAALSVEEDDQEDREEDGLPDGMRPRMRRGCRPSSRGR